MIKEDLQVEGHEIRQIFNVLHRKTSEKLLLYFLDLEPKPNRRDIFNIKYINQVYQPTKLQLKHPTRKRKHTVQKVSKIWTLKINASGLSDVSNAVVTQQVHVSKLQR